MLIVSARTQNVGCHNKTAKIIISLMICVCCIL